MPRGLYGKMAAKPFLQNKFSDLYVIRDDFRETGFSVRIAEHVRKQVGREGDFALKLIERWGMVMAGDGGEDTAGRAKLRPLSSEEVVDKAFECAKLAFEQLEARGLLNEIPAYDALMESVKDLEDKNE